MRVVHIHHFYPPDSIGGMDNHVQELCEALVKRGVEADALVSSPSRFGQSMTINGVNVRKMPTYGYISRKPFTPSLLSELRRSPHDLIHIHLANPMAAAAALLARPSPPIVVTYHMDITRQRLALTLVRPMVHALLGRAKRVLATSPNYIETSEFLQPIKHKCIPVPYGIDVDPSPPSAEQVGALRERFGPSVVLFVGRLTYYKSLPVLLRAMQQVKGSLVIVGSGVEEQSWREQARELGLNDRVFFEGEVTPPDLYAYYAASDVFVLPSEIRTEAFGIVQLEAQLFGVPCVSTRIGTGTDFANLDGVTGLTVPPSDPALLAEAITTLLRDEKLRREFGANGRRRVLADFGRDRMVDDILGIYAEVLAEDGGA